MVELVENTLILFLCFEESERLSTATGTCGGKKAETVELDENIPMIH